jgi:hypothetical protein
MSDNIRIIDNQKDLELCMEDIRLRGKSFEPNPTTVSFGDGWDNMEAYDFKKEYLKIVKENNHEIIYRIKY